MRNRSQSVAHVWQLGALFLVLAVLTWRRSGDPLIDWGRELYAALSVSQGRGIPLDVLTLFGSVSPLVNGAILSFIAEDTAAILVANLAFLVVALAVVYDLATRMFDRRTAFHAALAFMFLSGFPQLAGVGNYNFITPYSHGLTHGLLFGLLCLASIFRGLESGRAGWWLLAGASAALAVGSKPEAGMAALLTLASGVAAARRIRPQRSSSSLYAVVGFILALGLISSLVGRLPGVSPAVVLEPYRSAMSVASFDVAFYRRSGGVESAFVQAATGIVTAGILALAILWPGRRRDSTGRARDVPHPGQVLLWRVAVALTLFVLFNFLFPYAWLKLARALPWISAAALLTCLWKLVSTSRCPVSERQRTKATEVALLSVFASTLLLKTGLDARFFHYGFALSAPATLLAIGLFGHSLPARARLKGISALRARVAAPAVVLFLVLSAASQSAAFYSRRTVPLEYGSDLLFITSAEFDPRTPTVLRLLRELADSGPFHDGAVVLPEGPMFHYMLRAPSAVPVASLMPLEIQLVGPQRVLGMVEAANPPLVVVVEPDLKLWHTLGRPDGHPYELLREWIKLHYCEKKRFGNDRSDVYRLDVTFYEACGASGDIHVHGKRPTALTADRVTN